MGRHRGSGGASVATRDDVVETVGRELTAANVDKSADNSSDHIAQEAVGGYLEIEGRLAAFDPFGAGDAAYIRPRVGMKLGEGGEVADIEKTCGRAVHGVEIERTCCPCEFVEKGGATRQHIIAVGSRDSTEPGVHVIGHRPYTLHYDVRPHYRIESARHRGYVRNGVGIEMGNHAAGVHSGVGAAGADNSRRSAQQNRQRILESRLDSHLSGLRLPAVERRARYASCMK